MADKQLRIVFMGTPDFAVESLKALVENQYNIVGVVTAPDRPAGRGQKLKQSPVKEYALSVNIPVLQPEKLKNPEFLEELKALKADLQIIVAFRMLPEAVWNMPPMGSFNLHGSLLPRYRGAAPINWAVINGDKETGVTTFFLKHEIDTGNIIFQEKMPITDDDTAGTVHDKMMVLGAGLVVKTVKAIEEGRAEALPQDNDDNLLKHAPKIFKDDCRIDWQQDAESIRNHIRGLSPYPTAWTEFKMKTGKDISCKLFFAERNKSKQLAPGQFDSDNKTYLSIGTGNGVLNITQLQLAGKKRMTIEELLRGFDCEQIESIL
ncbi:methionyl-tRNA formyltransferase [Carboxylicivirga sediminis]|nr:methionyl-tRNA formyltransferase [Carboxylicivirga sediminis]